MPCQRQPPMVKCAQGVAATVTTWCCSTSRRSLQRCVYTHATCVCDCARVNVWKCVLSTCVHVFVCASVLPPVVLLQSAAVF